MVCLLYKIQVGQLIQINLMEKIAFNVFLYTAYIVI